MAGIFLNSTQANLIEQYLGEKPYKIAKSYFDGTKTTEDGRLLVTEQSLNVLGSCLKNEPLVGLYSLYIAFSEALETRKREDRERQEREQREQRERQEREQREQLEREQQEQHEKQDNIIDSSQPHVIETPEVTEVLTDEQVMEKVD